MLPELDKNKMKANNPYDRNHYISIKLKEFMSKNSDVTKSLDEEAHTNFTGFRAAHTIKKYLKNCRALYRVFILLDYILEQECPNMDDAITYRRSIWKLNNSLHKQIRFFTNLLMTVRQVEIDNAWEVLIDGEVKKSEKRLERLKNVNFYEFVEMTSLHVYNEYLKNEKDMDIFDDISNCYNEIVEEKFSDVAKRYFDEQIKPVLDSIHSDEKYKPIFQSVKDKYTAYCTHKKEMAEKIKQEKLEEERNRLAKLKDDSVAFLSKDIERLYRSASHKQRINIFKLNETDDEEHYYTLICHSKNERDNKKTMFLHMSGMQTGNLKYTVTSDVDKTTLFNCDVLENVDKSLLEAIDAKYFIFDVCLDRGRIVNLRIDKNINEANSVHNIY